MLATHQWYLYCAYGISCLSLLSFIVWNLRQRRKFQDLLQAIKKEQQ